MVRRLILVTILMGLSSGPAYAEWKSVGKSDQGGTTVYADPSSVRRKGDVAKLWEMFDFKTVQPAREGSFLSRKAQFEYDCAEERNRALASTLFSGNLGTGNVVNSESYEGKESKWEPIIPGSFGETLWKIACAKP